MIEIPLPSGEVALIDDADAPMILEHTWHIRKNGKSRYAATKKTTAGKTKVTFMHRMLLGCDREIIRFKNGNGLDCRRKNLVVAGRSALVKTTEIGALGEAMVIADLTKNGHDVFVPLAGHTPADLISVKGSHRPLRWQVKSRRVTARSKSIHISFMGIQPAKGGYLRKRFDTNLVDAYAIYCPDTQSCYYVALASLPKGTNSFALCLGPNASGSGARDALDFVSPDLFDTI